MPVATAKLFGDAGYVVKQVTEVDIPLTFTSFNLGV